MFYLRKKKADTSLTKTFCEKYENQRNQRQPAQVSARSFFMLAVVGFALATSLCSAWDGAGDTWTCSNCGGVSYTWQNSCANCGK